MSAPAVTERVQRLRRAGVITGFRMDVDPAALGLPVTAFARIRPTAGQLDKIAALAREMSTPVPPRPLPLPREGAPDLDQHGTGRSGTKQA